MKPFLTAALSLLLLTGTSCADDNKDNTPKGYPTQVPTAEKIPVVAWHGVRAGFASVERFKEAADMGITINYSRMINVTKACEMLDMAAQANVKLIIECEELYDDTRRQAAVKTFQKHSALEGYFVADEPHPNDFKDIAKRMKDIQAVDKEHICYANIFPTGPQSHYDALGVRNYAEYVQRYLNECPVTFLSFDQYPIVAEPNSPRWLKPEWYQALEIASKEAVRNKMKLWTFLLTVPHTAYPQPTVSDLRLQAYSNLAYGSQVLQCFTYWTPSVENPTFWNYRNAPIAEDGTRTETYDIVKGVLREIQTLSWIFRDCKVTSVHHLGGVIPMGTKALTEMPEGVESILIGSSETALASVFTNHGYTFMLFQNTSPTLKCRSTIKMKEGARVIHHDGSITLASAEVATQQLEPGDIRLYMW